MKTALFPFSGREVPLWSLAGMVQDLSHQMTVSACSLSSDIARRQKLAGWILLQIRLSTVDAASLPTN